MTPEMIKKLVALCSRWAVLEKERTEIETQITQLTAPPVQLVDDEIRVGDLVEVVSCTGANTRDGDIGTG